ncbi:hypothetical protein [Zavarzinella formosa]|uniref:hypothetical protein n=1 Tax=Zavarzinella formosa TaxID=360055 RepID=UPI0002E09C45|nr:hypothetical protein [Zavarzinella formosa]
MRSLGRLLRQIGWECLVWGVGAPFYVVMVGQELGSDRVWRLVAPRWRERWPGYLAGVMMEAVWMGVYWSALWGIMIGIPFLACRWLTGD